MATLRPARASDAPALARVSVDTWRFAYRSFLPANFLRRLSYELRQDRWRTQLSDPKPGVQTVAAEFEGSVVGFVTLGPHREPEFPQFDGELYAIYVRPEMHRRGVGRRLLQAAGGLLRDAGFQRMALWVFRENQAARAFYERHGGIPFGEKTFTIEGIEYPETGYGWTSLDGFEAPPPDLRQSPPSGPPGESNHGAGRQS